MMRDCQARYLSPTGTFRRFVLDAHPVGRNVHVEARDGLTTPPVSLLVGKLLDEGDDHELGMAEQMMCGAKMQ